MYCATLGTIGHNNLERLSPYGEFFRVVIHFSMDINLLTEKMILNVAQEVALPLGPD
jgi:hypothetical protein